MKENYRKMVVLTLWLCDRYAKYMWKNCLLYVIYLLFYYHLHFFFIVYCLQHFFSIFQSVWDFCLMWIFQINYVIDPTVDMFLKRSPTFRWQTIYGWINQYFNVSFNNYTYGSLSLFEILYIDWNVSLYSGIDTGTGMCPPYIYCEGERERKAELCGKAMWKDDDQNQAPTPIPILW